MTEMNKESIDALIKYRLERANETLEEATIMIDCQRYNAAINRLYYACFYALMSALMSMGVNPKTHAGARRMLGIHIIIPELIAREYGAFYSELFNARITGDYDDFVIFSSEQVNRLYNKATEFIKEMENLLKK